MEILFSEEFRKDFKRIIDKGMRERILKDVKKLSNLPESGKPLRYKLKGQRRLVIKPFRIIYRIGDGRIIINCFEHRKRVYK